MVIHKLECTTRPTVDHGATMLPISLMLQDRYSPMYFLVV